MPIDIDTQALRGAIVQVARTQRSTSIDNVPDFDIKKHIRIAFPNVYNPPTGLAIKAVVNQLKEGPYPIHGAQKVKQFSFEYWYNYFFREVPDMQSIRFVLEVVKPDGSFRTEREFPTAQAVFLDMLRLGFKAFTVGDRLTRDGLLAHMIKNAENDLQTIHNVNVLFRGDSRLPEKIRADTGTVPQTQIASLRESRNIDKDWNPFKPASVGNQIWVRNGYNKDNCLFSAVSVTPQFMVSTKFPLLDDLLASNPGAVGSAIVLVKKAGPAVAPPSAPFGGSALALARRIESQEQAHQQALLTRKVTVDRPEKSLLASRTQIYVIKSGDVYNTQAYQPGAEFPEYAMDRIGWADHLAYFSVIRIHYSRTNGNVGHLIVVDGFRWLHSEPDLRLILGAPAYASLKIYLENLVRRGALTGDGKGGIPYQAGMAAVDIPVSPEFMLDGELCSIDSVKDKFMSARGGIEAFKNVPEPVVQPKGVKKGGLTIPNAFRF